MALKPYRSTAHWKKIRKQVLNRDAYTCTYCGNQATEVDHIWPKAKGGEDTLDNLVAACKPCNIRKRDSVFLGEGSTPPLQLWDSISPMRAGSGQLRTKPDITVKVDADSPFTKPTQSGG